MAVEAGSTEVDAVIVTQLARRLRYRCLVLQTGSVPTLGELKAKVHHSLASLCGPVTELEYQDQFDRVGALSCDSVLARIDRAAGTNALVLAGPLHYLDYWSDQVAAAFVCFRQACVKPRWGVG